MPRNVAELDVDLTVLPGLCAVLAVTGGLVGLVVYLRTECVRELLCVAPTLFAQEMTFTEVFPQKIVLAIVFLGPLRVTEVAEVMVPA